MIDLQNAAISCIGSAPARHHQTIYLQFEHQPRAIGAHSLKELIYRSHDLEVRRVEGKARGGAEVITFHSYHDGNGLDHPGFGEAYFRQRGIGAIHVLCRGNDWYQYPEMLAVTSAIRRATHGAERIVTYGASMGGYAAIRFAEAIGSHAALAISPQYSVDPRKMRSEKRWIDDQRRIRFLRGIDGRITFRGRVTIAYDPELPLDRLHVERFANDIAIERLPLPYAGHPASTFLHETGLLQTFVQSFICDTLDTEALAGVAAERSAIAPAYLIRLSTALSGAAAIAVAQRATALAPDQAYVFAGLADRFAESGDWTRAIEAHRHAVQRDPTPAYRWALAQALTAARYQDEALEVTAGLRAEVPTSARYHRHAANLLLAKGDYRAALTALRAAIDAAPERAGHRFMALKLLWRLGFREWFTKETDKPHSDANR